MQKLAAAATTTWKDFTKQHERVREVACAVAAGRDANHSAAVVGVYGSGKSTLLFHIIQNSRELGISAVWDEAAAFIERLVPSGKRVRAQEFVRLVHEWMHALRAEGGGLHHHSAQLEARGRKDVAEAMRAQGSPGSPRVVLLLDEMEQAHELLRDRVQTDDANPLRSLFDSCGSELAILIAYAPESFQALGDADRGRHRVLLVPGLRASAIADAFEIPKGAANFAWWASRGRARGVIQAIDLVVEPARRGEFNHDPEAITLALDTLVPIFGVPAVVRDHLPASELPRLVDLAPREAAASTTQGIEFDLHYEVDLFNSLETALMTKIAPSARQTAQSVLHEVMAVLDACSDENLRAWVPITELDVVYRLAVARAQESGRAADLVDEWSNQTVAALMSAGRQSSGRAIPWNVSRLANEIFPSPFTDPFLPIGNRQPPRAEVERDYFALMDRGREPLVWASRGVVFVHDENALERWLVAQSHGQKTWTVALISVSTKARGPRTALLEEAGRISLVHLPPFSSDFVKSVIVSSNVAGATGDFEGLVSALAPTKDLRRKVRWHSERLSLVLRESRPQESVEFAAAAEELRARLIPFLQKGRIRPDLPAILSLTPIAHDISSDTRGLLEQLCDLLKSGRRLHKIAAGEQLHGAIVVVNELLPTATGPGRWVYDNGNRSVKALLARHQDPEVRKTLAELIEPSQARALMAIFTASMDEPPDPDRKAVLTALQRLDRAMVRMEEVYGGLAAMLESDTDRLAAQTKLNDALVAAYDARPDVDHMTRILSDAQSLPEPWARVLIRWVIDQFAEAIQAKVAAEEGSLREWESCASKGRTLGASAASLAGQLQGQGLNGLATSIGKARRQLQHDIDRPDTLRRAQGLFEVRLEDTRRLGEAIASLAAAAGERGVSCQELVRRYAPQEAEIREDLELVRKALELLLRVDEKPPAPSGIDLRAWICRLLEVLTRSRIDRLRARLSDAIGGCIDTKRVEPIYDDDVLRVEGNWPRLEGEFRDQLADELPGITPLTSAEIARHIDAALEKQALLEQLDQPALATDLDIALRRFSTRLESDVAFVRAQLDARRIVAESIQNHSGQTAPREVLEALVASEGDYNDARAALEKFIERANSLWARDRDLEAGIHIASLGSSSPDAFLTSLEAAVGSAVKKLEQLLQRWKALDALYVALHLKTPTLGSSSSVQDLAKRITDREARLRTSLEQKTSDARARASKLSVVPCEVTTADLSQWLESLQKWSAELDNVEKAYEALHKIGGKPSQDSPRTAKETLSNLWEDVRVAKEQLTGLRLRLDRLQVRARLINAASVPTPAEDRLDVFEAALSHARNMLAAAIQAKVGGLSPTAAAAWDHLNQGQELPSGFDELLSAGLLTIVGREDE
ncbi:MAG: hypothetical protein HUU21_00575 [Polyangiaceae bacterium]|nr:hypothetical protein [Polyangiaceae bacterium]